MTAFTAIDRYDAPRTSFALTVGCFTLFFASCAFATYFIEDWFLRHQSMFEVLPDPVLFFWRPTTALYAGWCFWQTIRIWRYLRTPEAIPHPIIGVPYLVSLFLAPAFGGWFLVYAIYCTFTMAPASHYALGEDHGQTLLFMLAALPWAALEVLGRIFRKSSERFLDWWEETF